MSRWIAILGAGIIVTATAGIYLWTAKVASNDGHVMPANVDLATGKTLYAVNCAACHGSNLGGQEDWRSPGEDGRLPAPPHDQTGHTWHHGDQVLFEYTKFGGRALMATQGMEFDSGMPGFADQLSDQEIWDILGYIKSTWPQRIQEVQAVRTEGETKRRNH